MLLVAGRFVVGVASSLEEATDLFVRGLERLLAVDFRGGDTEFSRACGWLVFLFVFGLLVR